MGVAGQAAGTRQAAEGVEVSRATPSQSSRAPRKEATAQPWAATSAKRASSAWRAWSGRARLRGNAAALLCRNECAVGGRHLGIALGRAVTHRSQRRELANVVHLMRLLRCASADWAKAPTALRAATRPTAASSQRIRLSFLQNGAQRSSTVARPNVCSQPRLDLLPHRHPADWAPIRWACSHGWGTSNSSRHQVTRSLKGGAGRTDQLASRAHGTHLFGQTCPADHTFCRADSCVAWSVSEASQAGVPFRRQLLYPPSYHPYRLQATPRVLWRSSENAMVHFSYAPIPAASGQLA